MSLHAVRKPAFDHSEFIVPTKTECWVLPCNCELIKLLFEKQRLTSSDLSFDSQEQYQCFIRTLFLLALQDECLNHTPSPLATFARTLIKHPTNKRNWTKLPRITA